jgi:membrane protein implicated in regulation of membrane protease activity
MDIYAFILSPWFWLALTVLFTLIEVVCAFNLITIWFAISALIMVLVSGLTGLLPETARFKLHLAIFLVISIILLVLTRPLAVKKLRLGREKTNVDAIAGKNAVVTKNIRGFEKGEIKIKGQIWAAVCEDNGEMDSGEECEAVRIEGVTVVVRRKRGAQAAVQHN